MSLRIRRATAACVLFAFAMVRPTFSQTSFRPEITGISGARIRVSAYCKARDFYSEILGSHPNCPPGNHKSEPGGSMALWTGQWITLNMHSFYSPPPYRNNLLEMIGFYTGSAAVLRKYLQSQSIEVGEMTGQKPSFTVRDPEGNLIEFVEGQPRAEEDRPRVTPAQQRRIIHAGFVVRDQAAMEHFYKDILGFHVYWHGGMKDSETDWLDLQVPDGTDWIEFMLNVPADADKHLLGVMNHIALGVPDIHAAAKQLLTNGMKLTEEPQIGRDGKWQLNLYDPDDTRVELMEFTPVEKPCCSDYTGPHPKP